MDNFISMLQNMPIFGIELMALAIYFSVILLFYALLGKEGLYMFIAVAVIGANLQVLKVVEFPFFIDPVALGTILFSSTYLCTDILAEYESHRAARKGVWIGFLSMLLWTIITTLTIGSKPLDPATTSEAWSWALPVQGHLEGLFRVVPSLFVAGMAAYLVSQMHDIFIYRYLRKLHDKNGKSRFIWLRNNLSTMLSGLIDNTIFSLLAWIVLAEEPMELKVVVQTYIFGTYVIRLLVALLDTPFIYFARYARHKHKVRPIKKVSSKPKWPKFKNVVSRIFKKQ